MIDSPVSHKYFGGIALVSNTSLLLLTCSYCHAVHSHMVLALQEVFLSPPNT